MPPFTKTVTVKELKKLAWARKQAALDKKLRNKITT